jgi:hypothetical protein
VYPGQQRRLQPRQRTVPVASPGSIEGTSSEILLFGYSFERGGSCRGFAKDRLRNLRTRYRITASLTRRAGGRKAAKLTPRPALKWCNNDQQLEPSCHHGHRRPGGSDSQPPGEGRPVFLPVTARARRSVRGKDSRNVPGVTSPFSHSAKRTVRWAGHQRWLCESVETRRRFKSRQPDNVRPGDLGGFVLLIAAPTVIQLRSNDRQPRDTPRTGSSRWWVRRSSATRDDGRDLRCGRLHVVRLGATLQRAIAELRSAG